MRLITKRYQYAVVVVDVPLIRPSFWGFVLTTSSAPVIAHSYRCRLSVIPSLRFCCSSGQTALHQKSRFNGEMLAKGQDQRMILTTWLKESNLKVYEICTSMFQQVSRVDNAYVKQHGDVSVAFAKRQWVSNVHATSKELYVIKYIVDDIQTYYHYIMLFLDHFPIPKLSKTYLRKNKKCLRQRTAFFQVSFQKLYWLWGKNVLLPMR